MKISKSIIQERWIDYPDEKDVKFKIRPFPMSEGMLVDTRDESKVTQYTWDKFNYCVLDWKGLVDENDEPLECNEDNKKFIFDYVMDVMMWLSVEIHKSADDAVQKKT